MVIEHWVPSARGNYLSQVFGSGYRTAHGFLSLTPPSACMIAKSSAYAYFLEMVLGRSEMLMLKRKGSRTDPCGMPLLRHH